MLKPSVFPTRFRYSDIVSSILNPELCSKFLIENYISSIADTIMICCHVSYLPENL